MSQPWAKYVPDSETPVTPIPLDWHKLIQENIPVYKTRITTAAGGVSVSLPSAFSSQISSANQYGVLFSKETFLPGGGEIVASEKTTTSFKVKNTGGSFGELVIVCVFWLP